MRAGRSFPPMKNKWIITLTVMLPTFLQIVDTSVVNVSLDHIRGSLSARIDGSTWSITAYSEMAKIFSPCGLAASLAGNRRIELDLGRLPEVLLV